MALDDRVVDFPVTGGLNDGADEFSPGEAPLLDDATDCVFLKDGRVERRKGTLAASAAAGAYTNSVFRHKARPFTWAEGGFVSRPDPAGAYGVALNDTAPRPCEILQDPFARANEDCYDPDAASLSGFSCVVWCNKATPPCDALGVYPTGQIVYARIVDEASGAVLLNVELGTAFNPRVVALKGQFLVTAMTGATNLNNAITGWTYNISSPGGAWSAPFAIHALAGISNVTHARYDLSVAADEAITSAAFIAVFDANGVSLKAINGTTLVVTTTTAALADCGAIGIVYVSGTGLLTIAVMHVSVNIELYQAVAGTLAGWALTGTIAMTSTWTTDGRLGIEQARFVAGTVHKIVVAWSSTWMMESALASDTGVFDAGTLVTTPGYELVSKPRLLAAAGSDGPLVMIIKWTITDTATVSTPNTQSHGVVVMREGVGAATNRHVPIARVLSNGSASRVYGVPSGVLINKRVSSIALSTATSDVLLAAVEATTRNPLSSSAVDPNDSGIDMIRLALRSATKPARWVAVSDVTITAGGLQASTDGIRGFEGAIQAAPVKPAQETHASSVWERSVTASYNVVAGWVFFDSAGKEHRSAISLPLLFPTGPAGTFFSIRVSPPPLTGAGSLMLRVWKTDDLSLGGTDPTAYYLCYEGVPTTASAAAGFGGFLLAHANPTAGNSTNSELPYVSGGVLPAEPPPALTDICAWQDVLVGINAEDRNLLWYTKPTEPGIAPEWNSALTIRLPSDGGDVVSLSAIDDKLVCLKERAVYYVVGSTRDRLGQGNDPTAVRVSSDVGCAGRHTVAVVPEGLLFVANNGRGLCLLDRGMSVHRMRQAEDRFATASSLIHSAMVVPYESCVRWAMTDGTAIVLDYEHGAFSRFTSYEGTKHHTVIGDRVWLVSAAGVLKREALADETPAKQSPYWTVTTTWIKLAGLAGFQRVRRLVLLSTLGEYGDKGAVGLTAEMWLDYDSTTSQGFARWLPAAWNAQRHQVEWHLPKQKCVSIRIRVSEAVVTPPPASAVYKGVTLSHISLRIGAKPTHTKTTSAAQRGPGGA